MKSQTITIKIMPNSSHSSTALKKDANFYCWINLSPCSSMLNPKSFRCNSLLSVKSILSSIDQRALVCPFEDIVFFFFFFSSTEVLFCHPHKKSLDLVNLFDSQWGINFAPFTLLPLHIHWSVSIEFSNDSAWMYVYVCVYVWLFALRLADNHG